MITSNEPSRQGLTAWQRDGEVAFFGERFLGSDDKPGPPEEPT
jgi:hypothetical protein